MDTPETPDTEITEAPEAPETQCDQPSSARTTRVPTYIKAHKVKALIKSNGRRTSPEFLLLLDQKVEALVNKACQVHNGGKKTLDATVAGHVGIAG